jgi:hypothetical protein
VKTCRKRFASINRRARRRKTAGRWYKADSANTYSSTLPLVGFVTGPIAAGSTATIRLQGQLAGFSGLTPGAIYYVSTPAGTITTVAPANARQVGQADSATVINVSVAAPPPAPTKPFLVFTPARNNPPAASYATPDTRNSHPVLCFDAAANEQAIFADALPLLYAGGGLTLTLVWISASAVAGNVVWTAEVERHQDGVDNVTADSFAAAQQVVSTAPGTTGIVKYASIVFTSGAQMDSLAAGESFRLRIGRLAADAGDTMTGDAQLLRVMVRET